MLLNCLMISSERLIGRHDCLSFAHNVKRTVANLHMRGILRTQAFPYVCTATNQIAQVNCFSLGIISTLANRLAYGVK